MIGISKIIEFSVVQSALTTCELSFGGCIGVEIVVHVSVVVDIAPSWSLVFRFLLGFLWLTADVIPESDINFSHGANTSSLLFANVFTCYFRGNFNCFVPFFNEFSTC